MLNTKTLCLIKDQISTFSVVCIHYIWKRALFVQCCSFGSTTGELFILFDP